MYRGKPVIVTDILADPLWEDYRDLASASGLRASWSTPILSARGRRSDFGTARLIITPYYTKPADAISNAVASVVGLLAVNIWASPARISFDEVTAAQNLETAVDHLQAENGG